MATTIEFQALEYQLPDADRAKLIALREAACKAREKAGPRDVVTHEDLALAYFEDRLRKEIGVWHRRDRLARGAL